MRRPAPILSLVALAIVLVGATSVMTDLRPVDRSGNARVVIIPSGASAVDIGRQLHAAGLIRRPADFVVAARARGVSGSLQWGEYRLSPAMGLLEIVDAIVLGRVVEYAVTIPEGATADEIVHALATKNLADHDRLSMLVRTGARTFEYAFLRALLEPSLEGYLFPDTYQIPRYRDERDIVRMFLDRFAEVIVPRWQANGAGRSLHEIVTLASLIEREAKLPAERPLIAGVLYNRLRRGWPLQVDATVLYALGRRRGPVTLKDLEADSPYNTYRYKGLPPGPIASPGLAAIEATLDPAPTDYLFYVARPDGSHVFSKTYEEHKAAIRRIQSRP